MPILEHGTYNCPCEMQSVSRSKPYSFKDWPCALMMVIAKANGIRNCNLLDCNGVAAIGMRGMMTSLPVKGHFKIFASTTLLSNFVTANRVPLQCLDWFIILNMIIGTPIFNFCTNVGIPCRSVFLNNRR